MPTLSEHFGPQQQAMIELLTRLIRHESFSTDKPRVDALGAVIADEMAARGADVTVHPRSEVGDIVQGTWNAGAPGRPLLILTHIDTVWPAGTLEHMPVRSDDEGRLYGPGAVDMKGGITIALHALQGLRDRGELPARPIHFLATSDEEIGSLHSRELIEQTAQGCALVLVMEPPKADGALKMWRKGVMSFRLVVEGRAAHAGNEPEKGINAIIEFAQQALEINSLNDLRNGTSVSVTTVQGGMATNVIPARVECMIDTRMFTIREMERVRDRLMALEPHMPGAKIQVEQRHGRPPMEYNTLAQETFARARDIAEAAGITIRADGAGGGSDGNYTAALGIPTIDGIGAEGDGLHAEHEHVLISSLPRRAALLAALLRDWPE